MREGYMSGAAGLAAAKRRRGGSATGPLPEAPRPPAPQQQGARVNPMRILEDHERRLRMIEGAGTSGESGANPGVGDALADLVARIENVERAGARVSQVEDSGLRAELEQVRQMLMKVQTFAMETNTAMMKLQASIAAQSEDESRTDEQMPTIMVEDVSAGSGLGAEN